MQEFFQHFFDILLQTAESHTILTYSIIFFGAILDVVPPFCFFTYGELFFIPWAVLAAKWVLSLPIVLILSVLGGITGDNLSYLLGYHYGEKFLQKMMQNKYLSKYISQEKYEWFVDTFHQKWGMAIFIARFSGPLAWITPFVVGSMRFPQKKFWLWNTPGAILGISIFVLGGYFFGMYIDVIWGVFQKYMFGLIGLIIFGLFLKYIYTLARNRKKS